jgi:glutamate carboxypeptidase
MASAEPDRRIITAAATASADAAVRARSRMPVFEERLRQLVGIDSGEDSPEGRERAAELLAGWATAAGCEVDVVSHASGSHIVCALHGSGSARVALLGHHDTVFTAGTAAARPMQVVDGLATGPGVADMKGGLLVALTALEALAKGDRPFASVELHSVPDEEIRVVPFATIDSLAGAEAVLVLECGRENGDFVRARKTGAWLRLAVEGTPAHAGTEPELGRSAVIGLCHEVLRLSAVNGARPDLTVIAGTVAGGTIANVVPQHAEAVIDVRAASASDFDWAVERIRAVGHHEGLAVSIENLGTWPGIEPTASGEALLATAVQLARSQGMEVGGQTSGGMSDGCWAAARGLPTLDGLGPVGGLDHSPSEYIRLDSVPPRCAVLAGLCTAIGDGLLRSIASQGGEETDEGGRSQARP